MLSVILLTGPDGEPVEVQVFTMHDSDPAAVRKAIRQLIASEPRVGSEVPVTSVALTAQNASEPPEPARQTEHRRPATGGRIEIRQIVATSVRPRSAVQVVLGLRDRRAAGFARNGMGRHGARLAARATIDAVEKLLNRPGWLELVDVAIDQQLGGNPTVSVLVATSDPAGAGLVGATTTGQLPFHEAAVHATLDAINRQVALLEQGSSD